MPLEPSKKAVMPRSFLREHIYQELRTRILNGELQPGERLRLEDIANYFGSSRFPARDALSRLASDGLVIVKPQSGSTVALINVEEYEQTLDVLAALFTMVVREAVPLLTEEDRHALSVYRTSVLAATDPSAAAIASGTAVADLYDVFFNRYGNEVIVEARDHLLPVAIRVYNFIISDLSEQIISQQHLLRDLVDQANAGNAEGAAGAMATYFANFRAAALTIVSSRPELFNHATGSGN